MAETDNDRPPPDSDGDSDRVPAGFDGRLGPAGEAGREPTPDEPASDVQVDPQTEALIAAAEDARRTGPPSRPWRGPRSFLILAAALLGIAALAYYAVHFTRKLERRNSQIRMRALDEQRRKYLDQQASFLAKGFRPAGEEARPLTPGQFAELQSLRRRFGLPPVPPDQAGTAPVPRPETKPTTSRVGDREG